ncbi:MAG: UbiA family prenyltransferase [Rhodothermales bacterium]|nr:UbiA family prenyltransferase [Rhodothermales bacterium]
MEPPADPVTPSPSHAQTLVQWLRFLRWPNLVIIAATMSLVRYAVIEPHLALPGLFAVSTAGFVVMVISTMLIAAAGYVANDLVDQKIDEINRPGRVHVGRLISADGANRLAMFLFVASALALIPLLWTTGFEWWEAVFPLSGAGLLAYAYGLKCKPVIGNLVVSVLSALIPLLVFYAERPGLHVDSLRPVTILVWGYAAFAFATSLFREVIKDLEDVKGDEIFGCSTLAVIRPGAADRLARATLALIPFGLVTFLVVIDAEVLAALAALGLVGLPLGLAARALWPRGIHPRETYARISLWTKLTMLGGLALLPLLAGG